MAPPNVLVFPDPEPLAHALADDLAQHVRAAVAASLFPGHAALADERPRAFPYSMPRNRQRSASPLALVALWPRVSALWWRLAGRSAKSSGTFNVARICR